MPTKAAQEATGYKMVRVPEEDYRRLREAQRLLLAKGLESVDWEKIAELSPVSPPLAESEGDEALGLTLGFVLGASAAALAYLISNKLKEESARRARG